MDRVFYFDQDGNLCEWPRATEDDQVAGQLCKISSDGEDQKPEVPLAKEVWMRTTVQS